MCTNKIKLFAFILSVTVVVFLYSCTAETENKKATFTSETEQVSLITTDCKEPILIIGEVSACGGNEVTVPVQVINNPGIAGALIELSFDEKLTLKNAESGEAFSVLDYTAPGKYENPCRFNWDSESGMTSANGNVLLLTFYVPEDVKDGEKLSVECSYKIGDIYDEDLNNVTLQIQNGNIQIKEGE